MALPTLHPLLGLRAATALIAQLASLYLLSRIAEYATTLLAIPVPPGTVGMALLFGLLASGRLKLVWIERGAMLLVRHLGLFLIPYAVSFMAFGDLMVASGFSVLLVLIVSTALGMAATGWAAQSTMTPHPRKVGLAGRIEL